VPETIWEAATVGIALALLPDATLAALRSAAAVLHRARAVLAQKRAAVARASQWSEDAARRAEGLQAVPIVSVNRTVAEPIPAPPVPRSDQFP
jgi:hypothetical protein